MINRSQSMRIKKRRKRRLPSPLELSLYLFAVIAFGIINWTLLRAVNHNQPAPKSFESVVVEAMLEGLPPVTLPEDKMMTIDPGNFTEFSEQTIKLEPWMLNYEAFSRSDRESEIALEDWMINTSTWVNIGSVSN
jgi:cytoskeletal protein RodZ